MNYIGISAGFHDAAISVIDDHGNILFAGHSERYNKEKHTKHLCYDIVEDALSYATSSDIEIHYYERPWMKFLRQIRSGEKPKLSSLLVKDTIGTGLLHKLQDGCGGKVHTHNHHLSHAAAGFQTSPYNDATVVVIDAIFGSGLTRPIDGFIAEIVHQINKNEILAATTDGLYKYKINKEELYMDKDEKKVKAGKARAEKLTSKQRTEIAKKAKIWYKCINRSS